MISCTIHQESYKLVLVMIGGLRVVQGDNAKVKQIHKIDCGQNAIHRTNIRQSYLSVNQKVYSIQYRYSVLGLLSAVIICPLTISNPPSSISLLKSTYC